MRVLVNELRLLETKGRSQLNDVRCGLPRRLRRRNKAHDIEGLKSCSVAYLGPQTEPDFSLAIS